MRLVFNRKNKTLRASLTTRSVLDVLDKNYRTVASLSGKVRRRRGMRPLRMTTVTPLCLLVLLLPLLLQAVPADWSAQAAVEAVLESTGTAATRGSRMGIDELLVLLEAMNAAGIHFAA